jgi:hypothetical protein
VGNLAQGVPTYRNVINPERVSALHKPLEIVPSGFFLKKFVISKMFSINGLVVNLKLILPVFLCFSIFFIDFMPSFTEN